MKTKNFLIILISVFAHSSLLAQEVNFRGLDNTKHLIGIQTGVDYGSYYGISYGYVWRNRLTPIVIGTEFTVPFGNNLVDDWKSRTSVQAELWNYKGLSINAKLSSIFRRYNSDLATLLNVGSDFTLNIGYAKPKWSVMAFANYDKPIVTHIDNKSLKEYYPEIKDGWYDESGGNYKFGVRGQVSYKTWNAFVTAGKHYGRNFEDNPTLPFFAEVSVQKRL